METGRSGLHGLAVTSHVAVVLKPRQELAPILALSSADLTVLEAHQKQNIA